MAAVNMWDVARIFAVRTGSLLAEGAVFRKRDDVP